MLSQPEKTVSHDMISLIKQVIKDSSDDNLFRYYHHCEKQECHQWGCPLEEESHYFCKLIEKEVKSRGYKNNAEN